MPEATKSPVSPEPELVDPNGFEEELVNELEEKASRERMIARLRLLWENRRFLLRVAGYGLLVSTLIAFLIPKRYESTARLMPPDAQSTSGLAMLAALSGQSGGLGAFAGDLLGVKSSSALFVGILRGRTVEDRLIERFDLRRRYRATIIENARSELEQNTRISEDRKTGIVTITVTDKDPRRAQAMAQAYVEELDRLVADVSTSAARRERLFLEERLKSVKQDLDQAAQEFSQFASKNTAIDIKEQGKAMVEAAATLQGQFIAAQTELEGLRQIYTDNNVRVRAARARIQELNRQLERLGGSDVGSTTQPAQTSDSLYPSIRKLPLLGVQYADLYRRTRIAEVIYELLTRQYELARVQEAKEIPTVKVLDVPVVPERKSFPPRTLIISLGMFLSLAISTVWVLLSAHWQEVEHSDAAKALVSDVYSTLRGEFAKASHNGWRLRQLVERFSKPFRNADSGQDGYTRDRSSEEGSEHRMDKP